VSWQDTAASVIHQTTVIGENVFTQVAGVHADGDNKAHLYSNALVPERFGRHREFALGKNSGKANIIRNLEDLGLNSPKSRRKPSRSASRNLVTASNWSRKMTCLTSSAMC
jgi:isopropylmalate/homocitrate/citramalate synthase